MSGRQKSLGDSTLNQLNIGKFVNKSIKNKDKDKDKDTPKPNVNLSAESAIAKRTEILPKDLKQTSAKSVTRKCNRPSSRNPEEARKPPNKRQNKDKKMSMPSTSNKTDNTQKPVNDFTELEKRLLAGFESMIQKEIEPLKRDIKDIKEEQRNCASTSILDNCALITIRSSDKQIKSIGSYNTG